MTFSSDQSISVASSQTLASDVALFESMESEVRLYCRKFPVVFKRAKDAELYAEDDRVFLDFFCGAGALNYGHNNDHIKQRLRAYLEDDGLTHGLDMYTVAKREFLGRLREIVLQPRGLNYKVQFCGPTGTDAVEASLKLARKVTGRQGMVSFAGAYHGMSSGSLAVTGSRLARIGAGVPLLHTTFLPYEEGPAGTFNSVDYLNAMLGDPSSGVGVPAAVIVEPLQMEGGIYPASHRWLRQLRATTERHGILLICDEIQSGCGRTGTFFCFEQANIVPDIVTISKSISGYGLPLSLALFRPELDVWEPGEHTGTFRGNQLAFIAASASLDLWEQPEFNLRREASARRLRFFSEGIREVDRRLHVRGKGMVLGIDMCRAGGAARAETIQRFCFDHGLILEVCGRNDDVVKITPPLIIDGSRLERGLAILTAAIQEG